MKRHLTDEEKQTMLTLYKAHVPATIIAKHLGCTPANVHYHTIRMPKYSLSRLAQAIEDSLGTPLREVV